MATAERELDSWLSATLDFLLSIVGFIIIWYPMVSLTNAVLGFPVSTSTSNLIVGVLAFGGSYPVVAGDWSLGQLGEYIFVLLASTIGWGLVGMVAILVSGASISSSNLVPQAVVWAAAYLTAYIVVYKTQRSIFR
ncbi:hypothetical protein [Halorubrum distributum]|uniref:Uncharacterized protein n=1 Tax=Halorubrum distributum JCM 10247 TaxID=1227486 RepID=M0DI17_9EURY|nr:hypothetical protein [Halorubrum terrestre]ELZ33824.1 hypothetical protein C473_07090 [Halorubrum terrestre JCM 10247]